MKIGFTELLVILVVALVVLGPDKLPLYMKKLGQALREFRKYSSDLTEDLKENIIAPLDEAQAPLREALEPLTEMEEELKSTKKDIEKSFSDIGKVKKTPEEAAPAKDPAPEEKENDPEEETCMVSDEEPSVADAVEAADVPAEITEEAPAKEDETV